MKQILLQNLFFSNSSKIYEQNLLDYYNVFSLKKWLKYTFIKPRIQISFTIKGSFAVNLLFLSENNQKVVSTYKLSSKSKKTFVLDYPELKNDVLLSFDIKPLDKNSIIYSGSYLGQIDKPLNDVKLAVGICTYNRLEYLTQNINQLRSNILDNKDSPLYDKLEVLIADNGNNVDKNLFSNKHVHIYPNKNLGGSGGFARTMLEAIKLNENKRGLTHIILMDDDITFDTESLIRTYTLLSVMKKEYANCFIGASMFDRNKPYMQYCSGECFNSKSPIEYIESSNTDLDMRNQQNIFANEQIINANYQAWWYCAIPMTIVNRDNLPFPAFIHSDDIEYGIRNHANVILLNGINVWHSFSSAKMRSAEYYTVRNHLITCAINGIKLSYYKIWRLLTFKCGVFTINYKYGDAKLSCQAVKDYLKGPEFILNLDSPSYNAKLRDLNKIEIVDKSSLKQIDSDTELEISKRKEKDWGLFRRIFSALTLNGLIFPSQKHLVLDALDINGNCRQCYAKKYVYGIVDKDYIAVYKKTFSKTLKSICNYLKTSVLLLFKYHSLRKKYYDNRKELFSYYSKIMNK